MNEFAIRCQGLGKRYRLGKKPAYFTLRETLSEMATAPLRWVSACTTTRKDRTKSELWALKDLDLEIRPGEVVGIVGRNGSGKSTLLKILSRITKPTEGEVELRGRVGTLLEVGAGFHPELTGRENIFLNGAVLGMRRREIERKFDEIVEFAECGPLLDTAMKHFSSGMYVRLGFAVAAHLETDILLVDEVLAVGDAAFQQKCLGKIGDVAGQGRAVLFVSHNMLAVDSLCTRAICLHDGKLVLEGAPGAVTSRYLREWMPSFNHVVHDDISRAPGNDLVRLRRARVRPLNESSADWLTVRTAVVIEFEYWKFSANTDLTLVAEVFNEHGVTVFATAKFGEPATPAGLLRGWFIVPPDFLNNGIYRVNLNAVVGANTEVAFWEDVLAFEVHDAASDLRGPYHDFWPGAVRPNLEWGTELLEGLPTSVTRQP